MSVYLFLHSKSTIDIDIIVCNNCLYYGSNSTCRCSLTDCAEAQECLTFNHLFHLYLLVGYSHSICDTNYKK